MSNPSVKHGGWYSLFGDTIQAVQQKGKNTFGLCWQKLTEKCYAARTPVVVLAIIANSMSFFAIEITSRTLFVWVNYDTFTQTELRKIRGEEIPLHFSFFRGPFGRHKISNAPKRHSWLWRQVLHLATEIRVTSCPRSLFGYTFDTESRWHRSHVLVKKNHVLSYLFGDG